MVCALFTLKIKKIKTQSYDWVFVWFVLDYLPAAA